MNINSMIKVLEDTKVYLARPENDFVWSSWDDCTHANKEIDDHIERIRKNDFSKSLDLRVLFAPTGPIQEVSVSSGWGDEFLTLAKRYDRAESE